MRHTVPLGDSYVFAKDEAGRHPARRDTRGMRFGQARQDLGYGCTLYGRLRYFMAMQLGAGRRDPCQAHRFRAVHWPSVAGMGDHSEAAASQR
jgi:hypothetical protein